MSAFGQTFCITWVIVFAMLLINNRDDIVRLGDCEDRQNRRVYTAFLAYVLISCTVFSAIFALLAAFMWHLITK